MWHGNMFIRNGVKEMVSVVDSWLFPSSKNMRLKDRLEPVTLFSDRKTGRLYYYRPVTNELMILEGVDGGGICGRKVDITEMD